MIHADACGSCINLYNLTITPQGVLFMFMCSNIENVKLRKTLDSLEDTVVNRCPKLFVQRQDKERTTVVTAPEGCNDFALRPDSEVTSLEYYIVIPNYTPGIRLIRDLGSH